MLAIANDTDRLKDTIRESFVQNEIDGYWYPVEPGTPLVRIYVAAGSYLIERRRHAGSPWMPLVTAHTAEFDSAAFRSWRANWRAVE